MLEKYYRYKLDFKEYVLMFKIGSFYVMFDSDAVIMNYLFKYKLNSFKNSVKCGFPLGSIDKIKNILNLRSINYVIISDSLYISEFENNNYSKYNFDIDKFNRINNIIKSLNGVNDELLDKLELLLFK